MPDPASPPPLPRFTAVGGAQLGWLNATVPLAHLCATSNRLTVKIWLLGECSFTPAQVVAIERKPGFLGLSQGLRILHIRRDCPARVLFWTAGEAEAALQGIRNAGFAPRAPASEIPARPGFALRWMVIGPLLLASYVPAVLQFASNLPLPRHVSASPPTSAFWLLPGYLALAVGALRWPTLQRLLLKPGRDIGEVRPMLRLIVFISSLLLVIFSIIAACGGFQAAR